MLKCRWIIDRAWTFRLSYKLLGNLTTAAAAAAVAATDDDYDDYDDDDDDATFLVERPVPIPCCCMLVLVSLMKPLDYWDRNFTCHLPFSHVQLIMGQLKKKRFDQS